MYLKGYGFLLYLKIYMGLLLRLSFRKDIIALYVVNFSNFTTYVKGNN